jgi:hypothetical protein
MYFLLYYTPFNLFILYNFFAVNRSLTNDMPL